MAILPRNGYTTMISYLVTKDNVGHASIKGLSVDTQALQDWLQRCHHAYGVIKLKGEESMIKIVFSCIHHQYKGYVEVFGPDGCLQEKIPYGKGEVLSD